MTTPAHTHQAIISADAPPRSACGESGPSVARAADVTCPACLDLAAARKARTEVHDARAIPAEDEIKPVTEAEINPGDLFRDRDDDEWVAVSTGHETFLVDPVFLFTIKYGIEKWSPLVKHGLGESWWPQSPPTGKSLTDWERELLAAKTGPVVAVEWPAPAKTHDLSIDRRNGNVVIAVESETDVHRVYLQEGVARDLGRALGPLTPAQRQLLIDDLTGDGK